MKNVALVTTGILPVPAVRGGAVETFSTFLLELLNATGRYQTDVFTCADERLDDYFYENARLLQLSYNNMDKFKEKWTGRIRRRLNIRMGYEAFHYAFRRCFDQKKYDLVIFENCMRNICAVERKSREGVWVYHANNDLETFIGDKSVLNLKNVAGKCDIILTCSNYIKNRFQPYTGECCIETYYNALDIDSYNCKASDDVNLRDRYRIPDTDFVFLFSGRITPEKGILETIQAFSKLSKDSARLVIVGNLEDNIVGDTSYAKRVKEAALEENVKERITLTGWIEPEEMPYLYKMSDCVIVPSQWEEPFGMVVTEGMIMGKPMIVTKSGGIPEIVDESCAFVVERGETGVSQITDGMRMLMEDRERAYEMGHNGYKRVMMHKEWQKEYYLENFFGILDRNGLSI